MDTPYRWTKQVASHYGGTRNGMIVHWPDRIAAAGEIRAQWHHCIDVVPTLLEATGLPAPDTVDGIAQRPIEGTSFLYTFDDADAADRHTTQYFEIFGNRGIYHHGWTAVARHRLPWTLARTPLPPLDEDRWELYDTNADWTQCRDLAEERPELLRRLQDLFIAEASRYQVLPIDDRLAERMNPTLARRRSLMADRRTITLTPDLPGLREDAAPNVKNRSFTLTVRLQAPDGGGTGALVAQGGRFGGWSLYVVDGLIAYCYNLCGVERTTVRADRPLEAGDHEVQLRFAYDGGDVGLGADVTLTIDGAHAARGRVERTTPFAFSVDETMDVGRDRGTPVTEEYGEWRENAYTGTVVEATFELGDDGRTPAPEDAARAAVMTH